METGSVLIQLTNKHRSSLGERYRDGCSPRPSVRSPAPPLVALIGLLGILIGEQVVPVSKHLLAGSVFSAACAKSQTLDHVLGQLPGRYSSKKAPEDKPS